MSFPKSVFIGKRKLYFHGIYEEWKQAKLIASYYKKETKSAYFIFKSESGYWYPTIKFALYLSKVKEIT